MDHMGNGIHGQYGVQGYEPHGERGPMGDLLPKYQKDVKLSKRCQVVKKMSNVKKSNTWTMEEVHKKKIDTMRFTDIDINFDVTYDGH